MVNREEFDKLARTVTEMRSELDMLKGVQRIGPIERVEPPASVEFVGDLFPKPEQISVALSRKGPANDGR